MTRLKQLFPTPPRGDCMRTVFACLLDKQHPNEVPNFMRKGAKCFDMYVTKFLEENDLVWVEVPFEHLGECLFLPLGYCGVTGKSPRGRHNHIIVGELVKRENGTLQINYVHDPSPVHDGIFFDGDPIWVGFLTRKL